MRTQETVSTRPGEVSQGPALPHRDPEVQPQDGEGPVSVALASQLPQFATATLVNKYSPYTSLPEGGSQKPDSIHAA